MSLCVDWTALPHIPLQTDSLTLKGSGSGNGVALLQRMDLDLVVLRMGEAFHDTVRLALNQLKLPRLQQLEVSKSGMQTLLPLLPKTVLSLKLCVRDRTPSPKESESEAHSAQEVGNQPHPDLPELETLEVVCDYDLPGLNLSRLFSLRNLRLDQLLSVDVESVVANLPATIVELILSNMMSCHRDLIAQPPLSLGRLKQLVSLTLTVEVGWDWGALLHLLPQLETLWLDVCRQSPATRWVGTSSLRSLTIHHVHRASDVSQALANMPGLIHLGLYHLHSSVDVTAWLPAVQAMTDLRSLALTGEGYYHLRFQVEDWLAILPEDVQSVTLHSSHGGEDWTGLARFTQMTSLHLEKDVWSSFDGLWSHLPRTLTKLTVKGKNMTTAWLDELPDLPWLTHLAIRENTSFKPWALATPDDTMNVYRYLLDKLPALIRLKRDVNWCAMELWIMLQQERKSKPLSFWAQSDDHSDKAAFLAYVDHVHTNLNLHFV